MRQAVLPLAGTEAGRKPLSVGAGGDTTTVGEQICGSTNGCIGVYVHRVDHDGDDHDRDRDDHDHDH